MVDFYEQTTDFKDASFPVDEALYWSDYPSERTPQINDFERRITWLRLKDEFPDSKFWGTDGIKPADVKQGELGNCWFMVAASAIAEKPRRLEKIFLNDRKSREGIYGVNLYTLGVQHTVIVDDYLPL